MKNFWSTISRNYRVIYKIVLFLISLVVLVSFFPEEGKFKYEYTRGRPWPHQDLIAPFDFAILKSAEEIEKEKQDVIMSTEIYFDFQPEVMLNKQKTFTEKFRKAWLTKYSPEQNDKEKKAATEKAGLSILSKLYTRGIIQLVPQVDAKPDDFPINLIISQIAEKAVLSDFYTIQSAYTEMIRQLNNSDNIDKDLLLRLLEDAITHNVTFNERMTTAELQKRMEQISLTRGMVQEGERIISKGEVLTPIKFQILESLRQEYESRRGVDTNYILILFGQIILVMLSLLVLVFFLYFFRKDVLDDNKKVVLILLTIILMVFATSIALNTGQEYIFLVPLCIVPIIIRVFFDTRLALYVFIITIILIGFLVPNSFQFVFMQLISGIITIFSIVSLQRRSQFLFTSLVIFISYSLIYTGLNLIQEGSFDGIKTINYAMFSGSALLILLAYPLIYLFEKLFGLVTDVTLLELSDTNSKLLRELSMKAPGSFQHSLQVANLAEECIYVIGGNALLTRTGALYHDIGKMDNPLYFIENQVTGVNPHDELTFEESAGIIIDHVINGIEKARKAKLPDQIIDFIRTHHGTRKVEYFYLMHQKDNPDEAIDERQFTYPGPIPFSKETSVVMMADSVEAASRSLKLIDEKTISNLVETIINKQVETGQFSNSNITLRDITMTKKILKRKLMNIYHIRIEYPS
ncbi:MAG: HDIG domain-containing protein [Sphingobacteriia bacterium]|nr:HDIG domain-containing protein [Sphingobacteriia bacterium]